MRNDAVQVLEELDRFEIFPPPVTVRDPLAGLAAVVAVEHGRDGIHPRPIDVIVLDPFECARDEEPFHLVAAEIVDVSVPVLVEALTPILMFVERRSIEAGETPDVSGKSACAERRSRQFPRYDSDRPVRRIPLPGHSGRSERTGRAVDTP